MVFGLISGGAWSLGSRECLFAAILEFEIPVNQFRLLSRLRVWLMSFLLPLLLLLIGDLSCRISIACIAIAMHCRAPATKLESPPRLLGSKRPHRSCWKRRVPGLAKQIPKTS